MSQKLNQPGGYLGVPPKKSAARRSPESSLIPRLLSAPQLYFVYCFFTFRGLIWTPMSWQKVKVLTSLGKMHQSIYVLGKTSPKRKNKRKHTNGSLFQRSPWPTSSLNPGSFSTSAREARSAVSSTSVARLGLSFLGPPVESLE